VEVIERPALKTVHETIRRAVKHGDACILAGHCTVDYSGRASSKLTPGDRLIIIKQDGSVLVHRPQGYEPVNWQPPGSLLSTILEDDKLIIRSVRLRPREELVIRVERAYLVARLHLEDKGLFYMYGDEQDVRDVLAENPSLIEEGLELVEKERRVSTGFIDLLCRDKDGRLVVVEVKRGKAGAEAVIQLKRYVDALKNELNLKVRGILVAEALSRGVKPLLEREGLEFKRLDLKKIEKARRVARDSLIRWIK